MVLENCFLGECILEKVKTYLGLVFSSNWSSATTRQHVAEQADKVMHINENKQLKYQNRFTAKTIRSTILPKLTYVCENFGFKNIASCVNNGLHTKQAYARVVYGGRKMPYWNDNQNSTDSVLK